MEPPASIRLRSPWLPSRESFDLLVKIIVIRSQVITPINDVVVLESWCEALCTGAGCSFEVNDISILKAVTRVTRDLSPGDTAQDRSHLATIA
jgi:hypothetical protein